MSSTPIARRPHPLLRDDDSVIARLVAEAPLITEATRARLAALLRGAHAGPDHVANKFAASMRRGNA